MFKNYSVCEKIIIICKHHQKLCKDASYIIRWSPVIRVRITARSLFDLVVSAESNAVITIVIQTTAEGHEFDSRVRQCQLWLRGAESAARRP